jgi:tyrosinase
VPPLNVSLLDTRKEISKLSNDEKYNFVHAILDLKKLPSKTTPPKDFALPKPKNRYDDFVMMHMLAFSSASSVSMIAHGSPTFLPWHRAFLRIFEIELQNIKSEYKEVTIPYWDWTSAESNNAVWGPDLMGANGRESDGRVLDGQFAYDTGNWELYTAPSISSLYARPDLCRRFGLFIRNGDVTEIKLPTADQVMNVLKTDPYDSPKWDQEAEPSYRNNLEGNVHNIVHIWVGGMITEGNVTKYIGAMSSGGSPNDPVFWVHHANIDRLWADWQLEENHWNAKFIGYLPTDNGPTGLNVNDPMLPWNGITPSRVINFYRIDTKGYRYDKYFRDQKDRQSNLNADANADSEPISPIIIANESHENFDSITGTFEALKETLTSQLFPIH